MLPSISIKSDVFVWKTSSVDQKWSCNWGCVNFFYSWRCFLSVLLVFVVGCLFKNGNNSKVKDIVVEFFINNFALWMHFVPSSFVILNKLIKLSLLWISENNLFVCWSYTLNVSLLLVYTCVSVRHVSFYTLFTGAFVMFLFVFHW